MAVNLSRIVNQYDRVLRRHEEATIARLAGRIRTARAKLLREIERKYKRARGSGVADLSAAIREARARTMLADLDASLDAFANIDPRLNGIMRELVSDTHRRGREQAIDIIRRLDPRMSQALARVGVGVNLEKVAAQVERGVTRLRRHGRQAAENINDLVVSGMLRDRGWSAITSDLTREGELLRFQAERIARTESVQSADEARRDGYREAGIEYVQRIATQDDRVCDHCAFRAGKVYRVDEAPAAIHPNDRCFSSPWSPDWHDEGILDPDWTRQHARDIERKIADDGREPSRGRAFFEIEAGMDRPPPAVWTPQSGVTSYGRRFL